jgi:hypothetical protein
LIQKIGIKVVDITSKNIREFPPSCFIGKDSAGFKKKYHWLKKRFTRGLKVKQLYLENRPSKCVGFIEYAEGASAWRAVSAKGYMFIHCIWVYRNDNKSKGYGSLLIQKVFEDAQRLKKYGVATVTSDGPFMATKDLFVKNGFKLVESSVVTIDGKKQTFNLMVKHIKKGPLPKFRNWEKQLGRYPGWNIVYSNQCPWVARGIRGMADIAKEYGLRMRVYELRTARKAQSAPSVYATFSLIRDKKLLADHYISHHRFRNIIDKQLAK